MTQGNLSHRALNPGHLRVAINGRSLEYENGTPFFYLGDTAWQLFHRLNREEADRYLCDRAAKGFTVIQAVVLAELGGFTYGNNNVWQMWAPGREPAIHACVPWYEALDHPGAFQMGHVRRLFERYSFHRLVPDPAVILDGATSGGAKVRAARAEDGAFLLVYSPRGERFTVNKRVLCVRRVRESWYDPRYGTLHQVHTSDNAGFQTYTPPTCGRGNDWVLVLEGVQNGS
jgi:hypothetical protein